jgi:hypothetical protein
MGILLDSVTLDDWRDVVTGALQAAKAGDAQSRAWLAQYLVGKSIAKAPTPLTVVVQQLNGADPVVDRLSSHVITELQFPEESWKDNVKTLITAELGEKVVNPATSEKPDVVRLSGENDENE